MQTLDIDGIKLQYVSVMSYPISILLSKSIFKTLISKFVTSISGYKDIEGPISKVSKAPDVDSDHRTSDCRDSDCGHSDCCDRDSD